MKHAVVTGAAGFIGSHVTEKLLSEGWRVTGVDSFDRFYDPAVKHQNLRHALTCPGFRLIEADIRDAPAMQSALSEDVDVVVHLAARAGVRPSIEQPALYQDVNITGTVVLLETARQHGIKKFIFASSSSVYGNNRKVPFSETDNVDFPISPYAATKKSGELLCHTYHHLFNLHVICLRFFTVYGPRQRPDLAIHKFSRLIEAGETIPMFGDGTSMRDYTFIDDIVAGVYASIMRCDGYHIYNLGNSSPVSLRELIGLIEEALDKKANIEKLPQQPGDVDQTFADVERAKADLGYKPETDLRAGLAEFVSWLRQAEKF